MKNKIFHYGFYLDTLKRIKGISVFIIALSVVSSGIVGITLLANYTSALSDKQFFEIDVISLFDMASITGLLTVLFVPLLTVVAFSYLFKRNESDFFESLPIKRSAMAISGVLAVLSVFSVALIGSVLVFVITTIPCIGNYYTVDMANFALELLAVFIAALLGAAVTLVAISITGTQIYACVSAASLLIIPRVIMGIFTNTLQMLNPTLVSDKIIPIFNSQMNLYYSLLAGDFKPRESAQNYVYSFALSIAVMLVGIGLMSKRDSEWATQSYVKNTPRHIISILIALVPMSFGIQCFCDYDVMLWGIILAVISFAVLLISEKASLSKGDKNKGGILAIIFFVVLSLSYYGAVIFADSSLAKYSPRAEDIEYVSIMFDEGEDGWLSDLYNEYRSYEQYVTMRAEGVELRDPEVKMIVSSAIKEGADEDAVDKTSMIVKVKTDSGVDYRKIYITFEDYSTIQSALMSNSEYSEIWLNVSEGAKYPHTYYGGVYIYADTLGDVLSTMEAEIRETGVNSYREGGYTVCTIEYIVYLRGEKYNVSINVYDYMTKTVAKLENAKKAVAEREIQEFKDNLKAVIATGKLDYISINCYADDMYYYLYIEDDFMNCDEFITDVASLITIDNYNAFRSSINLSIVEDGIFGTSYYYSFTIDEGVTLDEINAFFVKYGYEPVEYEVIE